MRADIFYRKHLYILGFLLLSVVGYAQETVSKKIEKSYSLKNDGKFLLNNKYGTVIINGWDKDEVKLTIDIEVSHKKRGNALDLLERIHSNIMVTRNIVDITSEIGEKSTSFFSKYFDKMNPFDLDKSNVKINYTVFVPSKVDMELTNKFGDIILSDWKGKLRAKIEHGDIWLNDNLTDANIEVRFGRLNANGIDYGHLNLKNSNLDLEEAKQLRIISSGSDMEINNVSLLDIDSSKDVMHINHVTTMEGKVDFSKVYINTLGEEISLRAKVADLKISAIEKPDSKIHIDQESSEININISGQSLIFNATLEQGLLRIPKTFTDINTDVINKGKKIRNINATYGKGPYGEFTLNGLKGVIIIKD